MCLLFCGQQFALGFVLWCLGSLTCPDSLGIVWDGWDSLFTYLSSWKRLAYVSSCGSNNILRGREQKLLRSLESKALKLRKSLSLYSIGQSKSQASLYSVGNVSHTYIIKVAAWLIQSIEPNYNNFVIIALQFVEYVLGCLVTYWAFTMCQALYKIGSFIYITCNPQQLWIIVMIIVNLWIQKKA